MTAEQQTPSNNARYWLALPFVVAIALGGIILGLQAAQNNNEFHYFGIGDTLVSTTGQVMFDGYNEAVESYGEMVPSILWPIIVTAFAYIPEIHWHAPFAVDALGLLGAMALGLTLLGRMDLYKTYRGYALAAGFATVVLVFMNGVPIALLGTGYGASLFFAMLTLHGLARMLDTGRVPWWLPFAIIVGPLFNYGIAPFSDAAIIALLLRRRFSVAIACAIVYFGLLLGYTVYLTQVGAGFFPSSAYGHLDFSSFMAFFANAQQNVSGIDGRVIAAVCGALVVQAIANRRNPQGIIQIFAVIALLSFILFGNPAQMYMPEQTIFVIVTGFVLLYTHDAFIRRISDSVPTAQTIAVAAIITFILLPQWTPQLLGMPPKTPPQEQQLLPEVDAEEVAASAEGPNQE